MGTWEFQAWGARRCRLEWDSIVWATRWVKSFHDHGQLLNENGCKILFLPLTQPCCHCPAQGPPEQVTALLPSSDLICGVEMRPLRVAVPG